MRPTDLILGCCASLLVLAAPGAASERKTPTSACAGIQVTAPDAPAPTKRKAKKKPTFSASSILDLELEVALSPALKGQRRLELKVYTPKGHLYQTLSTTVKTNAASLDRRKRESPKRTAAAMLPVAGTTIVTSSLYGEWKVEAILDGERETTCGKPLYFLIDP